MHLPTWGFCLCCHKPLIFPENLIYSDLLYMIWNCFIHSIILIPLCSTLLYFDHSAILFLLRLPLLTPLRSAPLHSNLVARICPTSIFSTCLMATLDETVRHWSRSFRFWFLTPLRSSPLHFNLVARICPTSIFSTCLYCASMCSSCSHQIISSSYSLLAPSMICSTLLAQLFLSLRCSALLTRLGSARSVLLCSVFLFSWLSNFTQNNLPLESSLHSSRMYFNINIINNLNID